MDAKLHQTTTRCEGQQSNCNDVMMMLHVEIAPMCELGKNFREKHSTYISQ